ncbi:DUF4163 domain-containing protein [Novosphingobium album (ex Liu et al. 2023)]|uniref:DUF4163 domain-containing protein n=1 Tax=Novosphingobium album (ex Liu et al. 2023) TaxID=3031130 RepID=A0ABT5WK45_9SPHN|nr:DUF4163 domain-containing protein [Novosphingobium album (ex Liu et al. 2023)]MDE8650419.1 DUF4163 domain-containing protein [Novosphingobium album (ex Liu et al. 2023)]
MRRTGFALSVVLLAAACQQEAPAPGPSDTAGDSLAADTMSLESDAPVEAPTPVAEGREEKLSNEYFEFDYSYPAAAARYPSLKTLLDRRLVEAKLELEAAARKDKREAEADGYPFRPHSAGTAWKVVADLPDWLSLSAEIYAFSGGAHGMSNFATLLWDKRVSIPRKPVDLFASGAALRGAIQQPFCDALNRERGKRRGQPVNPASGDEFDACLDPLESTLILGSSNGATFDRIGVLIAPYDAGPYAEGSYEVTLPVTDAVLAAVKPSFRPAFALGS